MASVAMAYRQAFQGDGMMFLVHERPGEARLLLRPLPIR
jgi:hypothetical protein